MSEQPELQYWWVNHRQAMTTGSGDSLWTPLQGKSGAVSESMRNMTRVQPGDLLFVHAEGAVRGIGVALHPALEASGPSGRGRGWQLPVRIFELVMPLDPKSHMAALKELLPVAHSPLRASGVRNPAIYLASVPEPMAEALRALLTGQVEDVEAQIKAAVESELADDWMETAIRQRTDIAPEHRQQLIRARRGLGVFRRSLEQFESACRVTGLLDRRHLRACHIKPWSASEDREKLDGCNGLLLSPHIAHLFARGYISFGDDGALLISRHLNPAVLSAWRLPMPYNVGAFQPRQLEYLAYHRREIFDKPGIGRRALVS